MANEIGSPPHPQSERGLLNFSVPIQPGNAWFVEEPNLKEEKAQIWKSQVLIPQSDSSYAHLGPIEKSENEELKEIFPCYQKRLPLIFARNLDVPYNLHYIETRVFRAAPRVQNVEDYISWLNKVEKKKGDLWKEIGILDLIQLSRYGPRYQKPNVLAALHFWNPSTYSLHLKCGMLTPTLLDVAVIIGLKPTVELFDPDTCESDLVYNFDKDKAAFGNYIDDHHI